VSEPNEAPRPEDHAVSRSFIIAARVALLLAAAAAVGAAVVSGVRGRAAAADSGLRYLCPMHPEVKAAAPGQCPICRMALEPAGAGDGAAAADLTAVENVRKHKILDFVRLHSLLPNLQDLRGPAWVESDGAISALFYNDQIEALAADEVGAFSLTEAPTIVSAVRRTADAAVRWDQSTSRLRFRSGGAATSLRPGQVGWLELPRRSRPVLGVPASAVLQSPEGPYVLAVIGDGKFEKRAIEVGETFLKQGFVVVLSGLRAHDRVVGRATFFLDADRRLGSRAGEAGLAAP
jgi:hypothetical protein